ncbi:hypothetical protein ADEAN_000170500 [Angomonas deanei]|uniref:Uncharacterized protein n=1 Tax=Angomonas deanei TaxID=59799 RepID=A0A7G2C3J0_9TRYP|nr:hypothetical protein ADEAN_000170500 [Angomonas deanei]
MCKLEFTEGAAVNGIGVELPSTIVTTLRRIPDAKERLRSLLEDPTPEEVEQRFLENSFEELTEEKALYFVFQQLQMYVAVEGTVLNIRCLPEWQMADEDGRTLFKERQFSSGTRSKRGGEESVVGSALKLSQFSIYFRKLVLEAHSQPVTNLYMDNRSRYIWLSRNDGLLSIFSMDSKRIITKIPHPCAECAVVAGSYTSWLREQEEYRTQLSDAKTRPKLEWHRETRHFPQSHFTSVVPFLKSTRPVFMLMTKTKTASATSYRDSMTYEDSLLWNFGSMLSNSSSVWSLDARQSLEDSCVTMRENNMSLFIDELRWVRDNADVVRKAQKEYYEQSCENIVQKVAVVINQLGEYTRLPALYKAFYTWLESITVFPRQHVMRTDRSRRLQRTANLLHTFQRTTDLKRLGYFYLLWDQYTDQRRMEKELVPVKETCKQLRLTSATRPTPEMMQQMYEMNLRRETFFGWLRWRSSLVSPSVSRMASLDRSRSRGGSISRAGSPLARTNTSKFIRTRTRLPSISLTSNVPPPQTVEVSSAPSLKELSHHTVPLDTLFLMLQNLWNARPFIMKFRFGEGESVLDESWLSLIESAEASAESDTDLGKRAAVFSYGLLPLLQGLLSSADEVLPTLGDPTVCKEVMSLLNGIELCLDYIAADAEQLCVQLDLPLTAQKAPLPADQWSTLWDAWTQKRKRTSVGQVPCR